MQIPEHSVAAPRAAGLLPSSPTSARGHSVLVFLVTSFCRLHCFITHVCSLHHDGLSLLVFWLTVKTKPCYLHHVFFCRRLLCPTACSRNSSSCTRPSRFLLFCDVPSRELADLFALATVGGHVGVAAFLQLHMAHWTVPCALTAHMHVFLLVCAGAAGPRA